jgi:IclR family transcriptional regulator, KDG regulon repressor
MTKPAKNLSSVEKALKILNVLTDRYDGISTGELSEELGLSMPTASRLLNVLAQNDFVRKSPIGRKYVLGKSALDMGRFAYRHIGAQLIPIASPYLKVLRDAIEESAMLEVLAGDNSMIIARASGPNVVSISVKTGTMIPTHVSAGSKVILAFSAPEVVDGVLKTDLARYTPKTITDPDVFKKRLKEIKRKGVALAFGEYNEDVWAMAAPVFNNDKTVVAAVAISMPQYRARHHKQSVLISQLKATAEKISKELVRYGI